MAITGDLVFAGKTEEYQLARTWLLDRLWPGLSPTAPRALPRDALLLVPGNHDVDHGEVDEVASMVQEGLLTKADQNRIATVLGYPGQRATLIKRHVAFLAFYGDWLGEALALPWWQRSISING